MSFKKWKPKHKPKSYAEYCLAHADQVKNADWVMNEKGKLKGATKYGVVINCRKHARRRGGAAHN